MKVSHLCFVALLLAVARAHQVDVQILVTPGPEHVSGLGQCVTLRIPPNSVCSGKLTSQAGISPRMIVAVLFHPIYACIYTCEQSLIPSIFAM